MDNEKRKVLSVYRMEQAEESLKAAKMCLESKFYKDCINRSYYVAFYAVKAVLAIEGVDFKRHKDAVAYFNKTYVASGMVSREVGKRLEGSKQLGRIAIIASSTLLQQKTQLSNMNLHVLS